VHAIYLRDSFQHWFHSACLGFSPSCEHTLLAIRSYIDVHKIERVITIGSSMGAHGALLFGALLEADHAIAFAPQVNIDAAWLSAQSDNRWINKTTEINNIAYNHLNISELFRTRRPKETLVYYDSFVELDKTHALTLSNIHGVSTIDVGSGSHEVAYQLAKSGVVTKLLSERIVQAHAVNIESASET